MGSGGAMPPPTSISVDVGNRDRHMGISLVSTDEIQVNPYQPRREFDEQALEDLSHSVIANGIIQPLVVRKNSSGGYQLIAGERRLRAAKLAGLKQVPVVIRKSTDREALELALVENVQRQDLNCVDEALAYSQLLQDFSLTQDEVARRVGKDRATVANHLRLLKLPDVIINDLKQQKLSFGHGKVLLGLEETEHRLRLREEILQNQLSVREAEVRADSLKTDKNQIDKDEAPSPMEVQSPLKSRLANLSQDLTRQWSARIEVKGSERRGKIVVHYTSRQELDRLIEAMQN